MRSNVSFAYLIGRRYAEGVDAALVATNEAPAMAGPYTSLALNYVGLAELSKARTAIEKLQPDRCQSTRLQTQGWLALPKDRRRAPAQIIRPHCWRPRRPSCG
jgi:hypothetical protein